MPRQTLSAPGTGAETFKESVTISSGGTTSPAIDLTNVSLVGFISPSAWTTATLTIEVSIDGETFYPLNDSSGSQAGFLSSLTASNAYAVDYISLLGWRYIRLKSSVAQGADRVFTLISRLL